MAFAPESAARRCPRCGETLAGAELAGNCPRCLTAALLAADSETAGSPWSEPVLRRLGNYELLEEVARGGMGVVFRARQAGLDREVAVKVLRDAWLATPMQVRRFRAEAANAAKLRHPNIVAVHEVGEEAGQHFFAMDLVRGPSLAEATREGPMPPRRAAGLARKVAEAVQHAHETGVLHRDLKPSNVLLDAQGEPHVTDFGLARPLDDESSLTLTGQVLGTPGYMAPEQAKGGAAIGPAADVYGLGALLFHLLTGRAPFVGASAAETMMQVLQREPLSPRLLNPAVPMDLAAVCLKCLAKAPGQRYGSVREVADDLGRFLDGRSTRARPAGAALRMGRWAKRNPALAAALAAVAIVGAAGLGGVLWQWRRADANADAEAQQRRSAEANFQNARSVIDRMFIQVADDLADLPRTEQVRRKLLEDALAYYQGFVKEKGEDPVVKQGAAVAYLRVGAIYTKLGRVDDSLEPLNRGISLLEASRAQQPLTVSQRAELARAHATAASAVHGFSPDNERVVAHRRKQLELYRELQREFPAAPTHARQVATAEVDLANALREVNRLDEAAEHFQSAFRMCDQALREFRETTESRFLAAHARHWWGAFLELTGRRDMAEEQYLEAIALLEQLRREQPDRVGLKSALAHVEMYHAKLLLETGRTIPAKQALQEASQLHAEILQDFPGAAEIQRRASYGLQLSGRLSVAEHRWPEAELALRRSLALCEKLTEDLPHVPDHRDALADRHYFLGVFLAAAGRADQASEAFRKAIDLWEPLVTPSLKARSAERHLAWLLAICPVETFRDPPRAVKLARQAMSHEMVRAEHWTLLGAAQYRAGDAPGALESLRRSMELDHGGNAEQWLLLAMCHGKLGEAPKAREWYDKAADWLDRVHPAEERYGRFRAEAARMLGVLTPEPTAAAGAKPNPSSP